MTDDPSPQEEAHADLRTVVWEALAPGFETLDDVTEGVLEIVEDDDISADLVREVVQSLWERRQAQLSETPTRTPTDDVRLTTAFIALDAAGVVATMCLGFDQQDGGHESRLLASGRPDCHGYVFFHSQDAARLAYPGANLYLGFDALGRFTEEPAYDAAATAVGQQVIDTLSQAGLSATWDGRPTSRILVREVEWWRPLP